MIDGLGHDLADAVFINVVHCEVFNAMLFEGNILIRVDISNGYQDYIFRVKKRIFAQPTPIVQNWYFSDAH